MNVISIGYGRHLFDENNNDRKRMELCAKAAGSYDMIVFTDRTDGLNVVKTDIGLTLHPTNSSSKMTMMLDAFEIASKLIKSKDDLPIITTQDPFETGVVGYLIKRRFGTHLTVQEHADAYSSSYWKKESFLNQVRFEIGIYILKRADTVRVVAERITKTLSGKYVNKEKITKLPVSIDVSGFISGQPSSEVRSLFSEENFVFLSVARFVPQKNLILMIRAFSEVYEKNKKVRLLLVGSGPEEEKIKNSITQRFNNVNSSECPIRILPWSSDVPGLMKAADSYLLTSNYEGWARVLIEAACCRLPVVTTDVGCANEVIKNGEHGYVVPVNDLEKLTKAMLDISQNEVAYNTIKNNLQKISVKDIPGTNISEYGQAWVSTLKHK